MPKMFPAAIAAMFLSTAAFAAPRIESDPRPIEEDCGSCRRGSAPAKVVEPPVAPPIEVPVTVESPVEEREVVNITFPDAPPAPVVIENPSPLYVGILAGGSVLGLPVPEGTLSDEPMLIPGAQVGFGGTVGYRVDEAGTLFGDVYAQIRFGAFASRNYESGFDLGGMISERVGVGGRALLGVRDLDFRNGTWEERLLLFGAGPVVEYNFDTDGPFRSSLLAYATVDYSTVVRDVDTFVSPTVGAEFRITLGGRGSKHDND